MRRRRFLEYASLGALGRLAAGVHRPRELTADVAIIGGGLGGCAAALALADLGQSVIMTASTGWLGGQLTAQGVPPDENPWVETYGATRSYQELRRRWRARYRAVLTDPAAVAEHLNPGACLVSRLCAEPSTAHDVLQSLFEPHVRQGRIQLLLYSEAVGAETQGDRVLSIRVRTREGDVDIHAPFFLDATENGALLPLAGVEHVTGAEPDTGELHASGNASPGNIQAATWCFALQYHEGQDHTIDRPADYDYWVAYEPALSPPWAGRLLSLTYSHPITLAPREASFDPRPGAQTRHFNLWTYRRLISQDRFAPGRFVGDISLVNWPQNDYLEGNPLESAAHREGARQLSLSLLYWLQTSVPREDGGVGWPGLRLCGEVLGTTDGLAIAPYVRESRRIRARTTVLEHHVGKEARGSLEAERFEDTAGIGYYRIDLHPSTGGDNYIDVDSLPFEIPLGALLPQRVRNLVAACKNIGTTHITNGCYRLHPVEWNIGESAGVLAAFCLHSRLATTHAVHDSPEHLAEYQRWLTRRGVPLRWPDSQD